MAISINSEAVACHSKFNKIDMNRSVQKPHSHWCTYQICIPYTHTHTHHTDTNTYPYVRQTSKIDAKPNRMFAMCVVCVFFLMNLICSCLYLIMPSINGKEILSYTFVLPLNCSTLIVCFGFWFETNENGYRYGIVWTHQSEQKQNQNTNSSHQQDSINPKLNQ